MNTRREPSRAGVAQGSARPRAGLLACLALLAMAGCAEPEAAARADLPPNQRLARPERVLAGEITRKPQDEFPGQCWAREGATAFRTPCEDVFSGYFLSTLQRAMAARGLYAGPITGKLTPATTQAIRDWQAPRGLDSGTLSLKAAKILGLLRWETP